MRVAMSSYAFNNEGGIERASYELALRMADRIDLTLVSAHIDPLPEAPLTWHPVPMRRTPGFAIPMTYSKAATRSIQGLDFDVIHNQGGCATRVQDVITAHSCHRAWWEMKLRNGEALRAMPTRSTTPCFASSSRNYRSGRVSATRSPSRPAWVVS